MSPKDQRRLMYEMYGQKKGFHDIKKEEYRMFEGERFYGTFDGGRQLFVIRDDFHLLRSVMIKDFDHFSGAQAHVFAAADPANRFEEIAAKGITAIDGDEWKSVRSSRFNL